MSNYKPVEDHESYGLVRLSRVSSSHGTNLFGSPIKPRHYMMLEISKGELQHGLGGDHAFDKELLVRLSMSEMQFAELITTPNTGCGTPCTMEYLPDGEGIRSLEACPPQTSEAERTRESFRQAVEDKMASLKSVKRRIDKLLDHNSVSKKRREEVAGEIQGLLRLFEDSAPFMMGRFEENAEKVVATAKAEITAHAEHAARSVGIEALKSGVEIPLLDR